MSSTDRPPAEPVSERPSIGERAAALLNIGFEDSMVGQLAWSQIVAVTMVILASLAGFWWISGQIVDTNMRKQAAHWIRELDTLGTPIFVSRSARPIEAISKRLQDVSEIAAVRYYRADGRTLLAEYRRDQTTEIPAVAEAAFAGFPEEPGVQQPLLFTSFRPAHSRYQWLRVTAPVRVHAIRPGALFNLKPGGAPAEELRDIGYIELIMNPTTFRHEIQNDILWTMGFVLLLIFPTVSAGMILTRRALRPLWQLQQPLAQLARGDTNIEVPTEGASEIAAIGKALNVTIAALRERDMVLHHLADHDALTGLINRANLSRQLKAEIGRVVSQGTQGAVLFLDLDQFKYINDTLGHAAGDRLLILVARMFEDVVRDSDIVCRFGGDEFVVLASDTSPAQTEVLARKLLKAMQEFHFVEGDQRFPVYCSIGVCCFDSNRFSAEELIAHADAATFKAKSAGRNRYEIFAVSDEENQRLAAEVSWSRAIKESLRDNLFEFTYQPIVDALGGESGLYEVLLRMPVNGDKALPAVFLPVAERFGLTGEIDRWVVRYALRALAGWRRTDPKLRFSINLSGANLDDPELLAHIRDQLEANRVPASAVVFEISEQAAFRNTGEAAKLAQKLRDIGCGFALDEFGANFGSVGALRNFPAQYLKFGLPFVHELHKDPHNQSIVRALIQIAQAHGMQTVAVQVEDEETFALLRSFGVDYVQGNLLAETSPRPLAKVVVLRPRSGGAPVA